MGNPQKAKLETGKRGEKTTNDGSSVGCRSIYRRASILGRVFAPGVIGIFSDSNQRERVGRE